jgi:hypothetical protein
MLEYVAMARAVRSWIAWREGNAAAVREHAAAALRLWDQLPIVYSFQWAALLPLIAVLVQSGARDDLAMAIRHARQLLDPLQQRLPDALSAALERAIAASDGGQPAEAASGLRRALALAQELRYL